MQCKCGDSMSDATHSVKTLKKAVEWCDSVSSDDLPIMINQSKCGACGRISYTVTNNNNLFMKKFN